jgi:hypothetical protein
MNGKRLSLRKMLAQFLMVSAIVTALYALVISGTDKLGMNPHRKDKIDSMRATFEGGELTPDKAREIVERKEEIDSRNLKLLIFGASLAVFTYGFTLYRKSK